MSGNRAITAVLLASCLSFPVSAQELRIGFVSTLTGPFAGIGSYMEKGWRLGLAKEGWAKDGDELGGIATRIYTGDD